MHTTGVSRPSFSIRRHRAASWVLLVVLGTTAPPALAQGREAYRGASQDRAIAAVFAPIFVQGLGDSPRFDYITKFDFDGDWKGDNNWNSAGNEKLPLPGYVYYSVSETATHAFVHYAVFHPRDYKGGSVKGRVLSGLIREGAERGGKFDPTGLADDAVLAHENDLEGCLVVVEKGSGGAESGRVIAVETLAHNRYLRYVPAGAPAGKGTAAVTVRNGHARLFVEPKGHGIEAHTGSEEQLKECRNGTLTYKFAGSAGDPSKAGGKPVGYELIPMQTTLWERAVAKSSDTYGAMAPYASEGRGKSGPVYANSLASGSAPGGGSAGSTVEIGAAFNGKVGAENMARPPWGWFDSSEKDRPLGEWFFDPAGTVKRHFGFGAGFSTEYVHNPPRGVFR